MVSVFLYVALAKESKRQQADVFNYKKNKQTNELQEDNTHEPFLKRNDSKIQPNKNWIKTKDTERNKHIERWVIKTRAE